MHFVLLCLYILHFPFLGKLVFFRFYRGPHIKGSAIELIQLRETAIADRSVCAVA